MTARASTDFDRDEDAILKAAGIDLETQRARRADCPKPALLVAAGEGALSEDVARAVRAHTERCLFCRELAVNLMESDTPGLTPAEEATIHSRVFANLEPRTRGRWFWLSGPALAAAAALVLVIISMPDRVELPEPAPPRASFVASGRRPPAVPSSVFKLEKPPLRLPEAVLRFRGRSSATDMAFARELAAALAPYRENDFVESARRLQRVALRYPDAPDAHFYLGTCRLFLGRPKEAVDPLRASQRLASDATFDAATWYLAVAYQQAGAVDLAVRELTKLCGRPGADGARACAGLEAMLLHVP